MTSSDDIITRLQAEPGPDGCYYCGEYGCNNAAGNPVPCSCFDECECDQTCPCTCHTWIATVADAATEINRLRNLVKLWKNAAEAYERGSLSYGDQLVNEARKENKP